MNERECVVCGRRFIPKYSENICCSVECGKYWSSTRRKKIKICKNCGREFWNVNHTAKYCCKECRVQFRQKNKKQKKEPIVYERKCLWCGRPFSTKISNKKYCSKDCSYNGALRDKRAEWASNYVSKVVKCKECGSTFVTKLGDTKRSFCCKTCSEKYDRRIEHKSLRHREYMKKIKSMRNKQISENYVEKVDYNSIYLRDKGVCGICGMKVLYDKMADPDWSGSIDHITPLSEGGEHSLSNCQLAHRICNSLKGSKGIRYRIDWCEKSNENNYWKLKFERYLCLVAKTQRPVKSLQVSFQ